MNLPIRLQSSLVSGADDGIARRFCSGLKPDAPVGLDHLVDTVRRGLSSEIIAALFELELAGLVRQLPGKSFIRVWAGLS